MIKIKSVFKHFLFKKKIIVSFQNFSPRMTQVSDLLPSIGLAGHLSQVQEKMCVLNLNSHRYTAKYMIKSQKQAKSRILLKLSNDLIKRARIVVLGIFMAWFL